MARTFARGNPVQGDAVAGPAVHADQPGWTTSARALTSIAIDEVSTERAHGTVTAALARVRVTRQVVGYLVPEIEPVLILFLVSKKGCHWQYGNV